MNRVLFTLFFCLALSMQISAQNMSYSFWKQSLFVDGQELLPEDYHKYFGPESNQQIQLANKVGAIGLDLCYAGVVFSLASGVELLLSNTVNGTEAHDKKTAEYGFYTGAIVFAIGGAISAICYKRVNTAVLDFNRRHERGNSLDLKMEVGVSGIGLALQF